MRMPRQGEVAGTIAEMLGAGRFRANCGDGRTRMVRIPGRLRNRVFIKLGNAVLLKPWITEPDEKADIIWRYTPAQARVLASQKLI